MRASQAVRTFAALALLASVQGAAAQDEDPSAAEAFGNAKELGTVEAWNAFLKSYPRGFRADLARAYLKKLGGEAAPASGAEPAPAEGPAKAGPTASRPTGPPAPKAAPGADARAAGAPWVGDVPPTDPGRPAVERGGRYMGFSEQFNRYYTDSTWQPSRVLHAAPKGSGDGTSPEAPMSLKAAVAAARPGTRINVLPGTYQGCFDVTKETGGTYDEPVVLYGERKEDGALGVSVTCCKSERQTCFNIEGADHVAIDGFELIGGRYGVRAVGAGYPASEHSRGVAVLNCLGRDQENDPFFSGQADWAVWERNTGLNARKGDGHGLYLSNGSDWNIVRYNETAGGDSSDFQINADPTAACQEAGIAFDDPACDAYAGTGEGGQGASDYMLIDANHFHHSLGPGANFASVRRSLVRNNVFGPHGSRHNTSFYSEVDNPRLGSSENVIVHNLFVTTERHAVQFKNHSTRNLFANNLVVGVRIAGGTASANPRALLMEVDAAAAGNSYRGNVYLSGTLEGRRPNGEEMARPDFSAAWFRAFPTTRKHAADDLSPTAKAPYLGFGTLLPEAPTDRNGAARAERVDPGPIQGE